MDQLPGVVAAPRRESAGLRGLAGLGAWSRMTPLARREARQGLLFVSPWIVGFVAFTLLPMIATFGFTFLNITLSQEEPLRFVGVDNYAALARDPGVWSSLLVTFKFAAVWLPVSLIVPFAVALGLNSRHLQGAGLMRTLFFAPYVVPFVAGCLIWNQMLGSGGWFNEGLKLLGWANPPDWLYDETWIYPGFALIGLWGIGAGIIINLAGLRGIPTELYEAARIDGANAWTQLRHVTVPMMSPVLFYSLILGIVEVLQYFLVPLVLKNGTGEPGGSTMFFNLNLFQTFFTFQEMSYGATMATFLFVITLVITLVLFRLSRRYVFYAGER
jgi:multiple sugar transport system permease protein